MGGTYGEMMSKSPNYPDSREKSSFAVGIAYQEKIAEFLLRVKNFEIHYYDKKDDQYTKGESQEGIEIKFDKWIPKSNRISIEVGEKTSLRCPVFSPSGILRNDNTKFYIQGYDDIAWMFRKSDLQKYFRERNPIIIDNNPPTIQKFYLSTVQADKLCVSKLFLLDGKVV